MIICYIIFSSLILLEVKMFEKILFWIAVIVGVVGFMFAVIGGFCENMKFITFAMNCVFIGVPLVLIYIVITLRKNKPSQSA